MSIIIMAASLVERVLLIRDFECCGVGRGSGDVAGVVESVTAHDESDTFLFFLVRFVIADYFAVSGLSVLRDVSEFDKKQVLVPGMSRIPWKRRPHSLPKQRVQSGCSWGSFMSAMYSISFLVMGWMTAFAWCC
jgi:hypothetical protein